MSQFIDEVSLFLSKFPELKLRKATANTLKLTLVEENKSIVFLPFNELSLKEEPQNTYFFSDELWFHNTEAVKSRLSSILGHTQRLFARNCIIKRISSSEAKIFTTRCHIMGYATSHFHYGLFFEGELVATACFSKGRKMKRLPPDKKSFELVRYCSKNYVTVVGGLSRLIHKFEAEHHPGDIMTYVDKNWGDPKTFLSLGFHSDSDDLYQTKLLPELAGKSNRNNNYKLIRNFS